MRTIKKSKYNDYFHGLESSDQTWENLMKLFNKHWRQDAFEYRQRGNEFNQQGEELLRDYFNHIQANPPVVVEREKRFKFDLPEIGVRITGKIDRIDRENDLLRVVDYKTSRKKENLQNLSLVLNIKIK